MATYEELIAAARKQDAAGNTADAKRLAQMALRMKEQPAPAPERGILDVVYDNIVGNPNDGVTSYGESLGTWLNRGGESMTAGLVGDEASALATGMLPGRTYEDELARYRANEQDLGLAGQLSADIAGGVVGALAAGGSNLLPQASSMLGRMGYGLGAGAAMGATQGFMEGEGGLSDRLGGAAQGGLIGGAMGGAAPAVIAGGRALAGTARDMLGGGLDTVMGRASRGRADRAIARTMERSGMDRDAIARALSEAAQDGQSEFRIMDALGKPGQRRASGIVRGGEEGADDLARFLAQRQLDQTDRVGGLIEDQLGFRGTPNVASGSSVVPEGYIFTDTMDDVLGRGTRSAAQADAALRSARSAGANARYSAAREGARPVDIRGVVASIDERLGPMSGVDIAGDSIDASFQKYRNRLIQETADGQIELSDFQRVLGVKQDLQDEIGKAVRAGENNKVAQLTGLSRQLDEALEASSEGYRAANDAFRSDSRVIDALARGSEMSRGGRAVDNLAELGAMTPTQRNAARIGYGDDRLRMMEATRGETTNRMLPFNASKAQQEMGALAQDPAMWERQRARENTMWKTQNRALGGSMTADNLSDISDNGLMSDVAKSLGEMATGNFRNSLGNAANSVARAAGGLNAPTRELIARALMSGDVSALEGASKAQIAQAQNQLLLEAALMAAQRGQTGGQN